MSSLSLQLSALQQELRSVANAEKAAILQRFFKTGPGEYGAGDRFLGVTVPSIRKIAKKNSGQPLPLVLGLLQSEWHEERLLALIMLVLRFQKSDGPGRANIFTAYLAHTRWINNWDLVDVSAPQIIGGHLVDKDRSILLRLAKSPSLWERRIAILATLNFIREKDFAHTFQIADMLLLDKEDLIHKAVGWMLREAGKRDQAAEEAFLASRYRQMPRTMLRYAVERFPEAKRLAYLQGTV